MKIIKDADAQIGWYSDDISDVDKEKLPTYRRLFKNAVGAAAPTSGEEALDYYQLGTKLNLSPDIELEEAEFKLLKKACDGFSLAKRMDGWIAYVQAQVLIKLKESDKK